MRNSWLAFAVVALWFVACSQSDRPRAGIGAQAGTRSGSSPAGGDPSEAGAAASNGGAPSDAGTTSQGGEPNEGGRPSGEGGAQPERGGAADGGQPPFIEPLPEPACLGAGVLLGATKLSISTDGADHFGSITPDERVIAWTVADGSEVALHYAKRASPDDDFAAPSTLALVDAANDSVTLSADGLRLVYVSADRKSFTQLVRSSIDAPFGDADNRDFAPIAESALELAVDEYLGNPVLGPDDSTFIYSRYGAGRVRTVLGTLRFSTFAPWPAGTELAVTESLEASGAQRMLPNAVSLDRQTLFLWDSAKETQVIALMSPETLHYDVALELGDARGAAPNAACSRVYFDRDGDLWTADWE